MNTNVHHCIIITITVQVVVLIDDSKTRSWFTILNSEPKFPKRDQKICYLPSLAAAKKPHNRFRLNLIGFASTSFAIARTCDIVSLARGSFDEQDLLKKADTLRPVCTSPVLSQIHFMTTFQADRSFAHKQISLALLSVGFTPLNRCNLDCENPCNASTASVLIGMKIAKSCNSCCILRAIWTCSGFAGSSGDGSCDNSTAVNSGSTHWGHFWACCWNLASSWHKSAVVSKSHSFHRMCGKLWCLWQNLRHDSPICTMHSMKKSLAKSEEVISRSGSDLILSRYPRTSCTPKPPDMYSLKSLDDLGRAALVITGEMQLILLASCGSTTTSSLHHGSRIIHLRKLDKFLPRIRIRMQCNSVTMLIMEL